MTLANNVAIVTGSGTGTGASIARLFAKEGAAVTITGRRQEVLARMVDAIAQSGGHSLAVPGSVTEEADVQRAVHTTLERFGRVDILVNNAGSTSNAGPLHEMTDKTWDETMDVFLRGVFRFSRAVIPAR
jgi:NAD(P)-dependent dehydrogenase (short-subunit alcohol dehydrogenase family)